MRYALIILIALATLSCHSPKEDMGDSAKEISILADKTIIEVDGIKEEAPVGRWTFPFGSHSRLPAEDQGGGSNGHSGQPPSSEGSPAHVAGVGKDRSSNPNPVRGDWVSGIFAANPSASDSVRRAPDINRTAKEGESPSGSSSNSKGVTNMSWAIYASILMAGILIGSVLERLLGGRPLKAMEKEVVDLIDAVYTPKQGPIVGPIPKPPVSPPQV